MSAISPVTVKVTGSLIIREQIAAVTAGGNAYCCHIIGVVLAEGVVGSNGGQVQGFHGLLCDHSHYLSGLYCLKPVADHVPAPAADISEVQTREGLHGNAAVLLAAAAGAQVFHREGTECRICRLRSK